MTKGDICRIILADGAFSNFAPDKKGVERVKRSTRTDMSVSWLRVLRLLDAGDKVKRETEQAVAAVEADRDRSREWKDRQIEQLRAEEGAEFARLGPKVYELMASIDRQEQTLATAVNYNSPALLNALQLIKVMGKGLPYQVRDAMIKDFVGDSCGLRCLKAAFSEAGYNTEAVDAALAPFNDLTNRAAEAAGELLAYSTTNDATRQWRAAGVRAAASRAQAGYGLDFDSPIVHELEHIKETTGDKVKAARITTWLKNHGGSVHEDAGSGGPTEMGMETLIDFRAGEADA